MADNDVKIKLSLDGDKEVISGLKGVGEESESADSKLSKLGSGLAGVGAAFAGLAAAAVGAGTALGGAVISAYADYEQNIGGIETLFGAGGRSAEEFAASVGKSVAETADEYANLMTAQETMISNADQAYIAAGVSANEYMEQVTSFSAALVAGLDGDTVAAAEVANRAMIDMSDNANKFGSDIGSIQDAYQGFAKQNYTMLDNLKLGYGGTQSEMARLINDSGVLGDTFEATAQNVNEVSFDKIIEAISVVQDEMGITGTTALEATETISGSIGMLGAAWDNLLTGLGDGNADVGQLAENVISSLEHVISNVGPVISTLGENLSTLGPQIGEMMSGLLDVVVDIIPDILEAGVAIVEGLVSGISSALPGLITALVPGLIGLVEMVVEQLPLLLDAGVKAVIALADGLTQALPTLIPLLVNGVLDLVDVIIDNFPAFIEAGVDLILALGEGILEALPDIIERLPELIDGILGALVEAYPLFVEGAVQLFTALADALPEVLTMIIAILPDLVGGIVEALVEMVPVMAEAYVTLFMAILEALPEILLAVVQIIPAIGEAVWEALKALAPGMVENGANFFKELVADFESFATFITDVVPRIASQVFTAIGEKTAEMAAAGLNWFISMVQRAGEIISTIASTVPKVTSAVFVAIGSKIGDMASAGYGFFQSMISRIGEVISNVVSEVSALSSQAVSTLLSFIGDMVSAGYELFNSIISRIGEVTGNVISSLSSTVSAGVSAVLGGVGDMVSAGWDLVRGLWSGITAAGSWLRGQITGWARGIIDSAKSAFGIASPSKVFRDEVGKEIVIGFANGVDDNAWMVTDSFDRMFSDVLAQAEGFTKSMNDATSGINAGANVMDSTTELLKGSGGLFGMLGTGASLAGGVATIAGLVGAGPVATVATAVAAALGVGAAIPSLLEAGKGLIDTVLGLPIISDIAGFFGHRPSTPQSDQPKYATMPTITTGNYVNHNQATNFSGPLIQVESMNVRSDSDIRELSTQLRADMNREMRARGITV